MSYRDGNGIWRVNRRDDSRRFCSYSIAADHYDNRCACCYLGYCHSLALHQQAIAPPPTPPTPTASDAGKA